MIPTVDLRDPDPAAVDTALQQAGFLLVTGHDVTGADDVRAAARRFFALPEPVKRRYAVGVGGRGWLPPGVEANAAVEGTAGPPDLKESFAFGPATPTGDPAVDAVWFPPNVAPVEVPELAAAAPRWTDGAAAQSLRLLELCATALGRPADALTRLAGTPTWTFNVNRYPPLTEVGAPAPGLPPVVSAPFLREWLDAIAVG